MCKREENNIAGVVPVVWSSGRRGSLTRIAMNFNILEYLSFHIVNPIPPSKKFPSIWNIHPEHVSFIRFHAGYRGLDRSFTDLSVLSTATAD